MNPQEIPKQLNQEIVTAIHAAISEFSLMLEARIPDLATQCGKINQLMRQEPASIGLLSEEEVGEFMKVHYQVARVEWNTSSAGKISKKKLNEILDSASLDDIVI